MVNRLRIKDSADEAPSTAGAGENADLEHCETWDYITNIIIFSQREAAAELPSIGTANPYPAGERIPSVLFRAARQQLGVTHARLSEAAKVTAKTINDVENAFRAPSPRTATRLRDALEALGARFITDGSSIGVLTRTTRQARDEKSRSPRVRRAAAPVAR